MTEKNEEVNLGIDHLLAGAVHAAGGELVVPVESILAEDNVGKQFKLEVDEGLATITLIEEEEE